MADYPFVQARHFTKGRIRPVQLIVIHSAECPKKHGAARSVANYFATTDVAASAHFTCDNEEIIQSVQVEDTAWAAKNANANGCSIEHAGYAKQTEVEWLDDYGKAMLELSAKLCATICWKYSLPAARAVFASSTNPIVIKPGICGHVDVPLRGSHWDPGPGFPFDYYLKRTQFYLDSMFGQR